VSKFIPYEECKHEHIDLKMFKDFATLPRFLWIYDDHYRFIGREPASTIGFFMQLERKWKPAIRLMEKTGREFTWNQLYPVYDSASGRHSAYDDDYAILVEDEKDAVMQAALRGIQLFDFGTDRLTKVSLMHAREL